MILAFFGILLLIGQFFLAKREWEYTEIVRYFMIAIALIFLLHDTYYYVVVPSEMQSFGNSGAGTAIGNQTFFTSNTTSFAYYAGISQTDHTFIEILTTIALWGMPLALAVYMMDWIGKNNILGERVK